MAGHNDQHVHSCRCAQTLSTLLSERDSLGLFYAMFIMVKCHFIIHVLHTSSSRNGVSPLSRPLCKHQH